MLSVTMVSSKQNFPLATRPNNCPIESLPSEILHIICTHLKPTDVANLRLASSVVAPVGLQYLVPEIQLVIAEDSFRKLAAIATHPVVSKYVTSLVYQADTLKLLDEEEWRGYVQSPDYTERVREAHPRYMLRSCEGGYAMRCRVRRHHYTKKQLKEAFRQYQSFCDYQRRMDQSDRKIVTAMKQLPNLKELTMSAQIRPHPKAFEKAFAPGFMTNCQEDVNEWPVGVAQMRSLLLGAYRAGSKIERLRCEQVNWRILTQKNKTFEGMKKGLRHLRELSITFSTGIEEQEDVLGFLQIEKCQSYIRESGRLKDFVTSAPDLERLEICFLGACFEFYDPIYATEFQHVVSDFYWPSLRAVKLRMIGAAEDHLVEFLERHGCTIKDLCIGNLSLSPGHWWSAFERMRLVLKLDSMDISGSLESSSEFLDFDQGSDGEKIELREGIESYLLDDNTDRNISLTDYLKVFRAAAVDTTTNFLGPW